MVMAKNNKINYTTEISNSNTFIFADVTEDKGGEGHYFRPHDLLCAGFASCLNIAIRMELDHMGVKYEKVIVKVDLDRSNKNKTKFLYNIEIVADIEEEIKKSIINKVKQCPVRKTLSKEIEFETM